MSQIHTHARLAQSQQWDSYLLQVKGDLLHHLSALAALLAQPAGSVDLSPDIDSELALVKSLIDIYSGRSAEDLEDYKTGFSDLDLS
jgi:hypothetical protein